MAKTLANIRASTRTLLDEATQDDWTNTEVNRDINYTYHEVYTNVITVYEDYYSTSATTDSVADQQEYLLPSDIYKIRRVEINYDPDVTGSTAKKAVRASIDQVHRYLDNANAGGPIIVNPVYYLLGSKLGLIPRPTKSGDENIEIWYIKTITDLTNDSDTFDLPYIDRYGYLIAQGAAAKLLSKGQQEEEASSKYQFQFELGLKKMQQELEDRIAEGAISTVDTAQELNDFYMPI